MRIEANQKTTINQTLGAYAYRIIRPLGEGGMAATFLASQSKRSSRKMPEQVVIKVAKSTTEGEQQRNQGILNEERILKRLDHANIAHIYRIRMWDNKQSNVYAMRADWPGNPWFCVYEYIEGQTLANRLAQTQKQLSLPHILVIARQLAATLTYLHSQQVVHMDITPANLMLRRHRAFWLRSPQPVLIDFGIACDVGQLAKGKTERYMAPERKVGRPPAHPAMDMYAFGLILYEMLTTRLPDPVHYQSAGQLHRKKYEIKLIEQFLDPLIKKLIAEKSIDRADAAQVIKELDQISLPWWRQIVG